MGLWALVWLFILSIFLPPLGLGLTIRYMKSPEKNARIVGWISLVATILAAIEAVVLTISVLNTVNTQVNSQIQNFQF